MQLEYTPDDVLVRETYFENDDFNKILTKNNYLQMILQSRPLQNGRPIREYEIQHFFQKSKYAKYRKWGGTTNTHTIFVETQCIYCPNGIWFLQTNADGSVEMGVTPEHEEHDFD